MIYLDNAATTWPKPPQVLKAMAEFQEKAGGNPGRSGHRLSEAAARIVLSTRIDAACLFGVSDPNRVIFTQNATYAINMAMHGVLKPGDRVVTSSMEHNAVMRPLRYLEKSGVKVVVVPSEHDGSLNLQRFAEAVTPGTRLVCLVHASNVTGTIMPVAEVAALAHKAGALILVDAAQTAGSLPIDVSAMGIDLLAFTGHKGPLGPMGTGGLVLGDHVDPQQLEPLARGGTGSASESDEQPESLPDKYESGTPNAIGIAGLGAGILWVLEHGVDNIRREEQFLTEALIKGLTAVPGVTVYGCRSRDGCVPIVSFTVNGKTPQEIGRRLDEEGGILTRTGTHDAPAAHRTIGTFPLGTVRLAPGVFTRDGEISATLRTIERLARA